ADPPGGRPDGSAGGDDRHLRARASRAGAGADAAGGGRMPEPAAQPGPPVVPDRRLDDRGAVRYAAATRTRAAAGGSRGAGGRLALRVRPQYAEGAVGGGGEADRPRGALGVDGGGDGDGQDAPRRGDPAALAGGGRAVPDDQLRGAGGQSD